MKVGFARVDITPPLGTHMYGFGTRDRDHGCESIHDPIFVRALYIAHGDKRVLILGFDLLFFSRAQNDQFKGMLGQKLGLLPDEVLINTSHSHAGPIVGEGIWAYAGEMPADRLYMEAVTRAILRAATEARGSARDATMHIGQTTTKLPVSRRKLDEQGIAQWAPDPQAPVCDVLPIALFKDAQGKAVGLLFSVSCHPSCVGGYDISADYPGVAMDLIDKHLGATCSLFLQGAGGECKSVFNAKDDHFEGSFEAVEKGGKLVAGEVIAAMEGPLEKVEPDIRTGLTEMRFPLQPPPSHEAFKKTLAEAEHEVVRIWARRNIARYERGMAIDDVALLYMHHVQLAKRFRIVAVEAEMVAELGTMLIDQFADGITMPLGYSNGCALYLPTSKMLNGEEGYEVVSFHEYDIPARFKTGVEDVMKSALKQLL